MVIIINGILCSTIEEVEAQITSLSEPQKQIIRNDFNGVPNSVNVAIPDVTPRQMRQALILSGVSISNITDAINMLPEPNRSLAMVEWEYSNAFIRSNPLVIQIGYVIGWNSAQLDSLWVLAASI